MCGLSLPFLEDLISHEFFNWAVSIRTLFPQRQSGWRWTKALIEFVEKTKAIILIISTPVMGAEETKGLRSFTIFVEGFSDVEFELGLWFFSEGVTIKI